jgi:hypothetical protein
MSTDSAYHNYCNKLKARTVLILKARKTDGQHAYITIQLSTKVSLMRWELNSDHNSNETLEKIIDLS